MKSKAILWSPLWKTFIQITLEPGHQGPWSMYKFDESCYESAVCFSSLPEKVLHKTENEISMNRRDLNRPENLLKLPLNCSECINKVSLYLKEQ